MKTLRILVLLLGVLMIVAGIGFAVVNRTIVEASYSCQNAERYKKEMDEAFKSYDAAKGTPRQAEAEKGLREKSTGLEISSKTCAEQNAALFWWFLGFLAVGAIGFLVFTAAGVSFVIKRREAI